jgi:hypothetical protein
VPVVFNFAGNGNFQFGGNIDLDNGLSPDQVLWNFSGSGGMVHLAGDHDHSPSLAFQGIILAPNDTIQLDNADLIGRVFGGDDTGMQINGNSTITAPAPVTTITTTTSPSFVITVQVTSPTVAVSGGTVTLDLIAGNQTIVLGTAAVGSNGMATVTVTDQNMLQEIASLPPGSYELVETFSGSGPFAGSTTTATFTVNAQPTTSTVPSVTVTANNPTPVNITVNVNTTTGPVTSGSVTINLIFNGQTIPLGTGTPGPNGTFTVTVTGAPLQTLSSLPPGTYTINVVFNSPPGSPTANSTTPATLVILPESVLPGLTVSTPPSATPSGGGVSSTQPALSPIQAALELAIEAALLENLNNPGAVGEAELFAQVFLGHPLPSTAPALMQSIPALVPQAGQMIGPALAFASFLGPDLAIENPMS